MFWVGVGGVPVPIGDLWFGFGGLGLPSSPAPGPELPALVREADARSWPSDGAGEQGAGPLLLFVCLCDLLACFA